MSEKLRGGVEVLKMSRQPRAARGNHRRAFFAISAIARSEKAYRRSGDGIVFAARGARGVAPAMWRRAHLWRGAGARRLASAGASRGACIYRGRERHGEKPSHVRVVDGGEHAS